MLALVLPPGQVPDEYQHFGRAYALSEGQWFPTTAWLPKGIAQLLAYTSTLPLHVENKLRPEGLLAFGGLQLEEQEQFPVELPASSVYSPIPYLFSALGIYLARIVGLPPLWIFYTGRLTNLLVWIALVYIGLSRTPIFRWVFLLLLLAPMSLNQAASYSADCITNAVSFLWICLVLDMAMDGKPITWRRVLVLLAFSILLPLTKPPYAALLLAAAVIPATRFGNQKRRAVALLAVLALATPLVFASTGINRVYYYSKIQFPGVDAAAQQTGIMTHPQTFISAALRTVIEDGHFMYESYIGILGWLDTRLPDFIYWSYLFVLILVALVDCQPNTRIDSWQKILFVFTGLLAFLFVAAGQWITWTPLNANKISGIQGRYLIPIAPSILLGFYNQKLGEDTKVVKVFVPAYLVVVLVFTLASVIKRFYFLS
jgi:uncharacterized membrane protein